MDASPLSANGRYVAFGSYASNLVPEGDDNGDGNPDVYVNDRLTHQTRRVSVASDGTQGNDWSWKPDISADGHLITFSSWSSNLVSGDTNSRLDVFVHDLQEGETSRASLSSSGERGTAIRSIRPSPAMGATWCSAPPPTTSSLMTPTAGWTFRSATGRLVRLPWHRWRATAHRGIMVQSTPTSPEPDATFCMIDRQQSGKWRHQ